MTDDHSPTHGHSHGHSHDHSHAMAGGWQRWGSVPTLRAVAALVAIAGVATVVAFIALWPSGEGRDAAMDRASQFGLVSERIAATVEEQVIAPCSYSTPENPQDCREITLTLDEGPEAGAVVVLPEVNLEFESAIPDLSAGDAVILGYEPTTNTYLFADLDRRVPLAALFGLFALFVIGFGRLRGLLALVSMSFTVVVLIGFIAPAVLDGSPALPVAVVAASAIAFVSLYVTHGFSPITTVALAGTLGALAMTLGLSWIFFELTRITGVGTEEALILPFIATEINLSSLLLGGAVIGTLGALDDITVTQVATVSELHDRRPDLSRAELFRSGIRVGREHIASTVNTLLLAYAGASMPLLLFFSTSDQGLDTVASAEIVALEIVRTLCGSMGLVAAAPITTALAVLVVSGDHLADVDLDDPALDDPHLPEDLEPDLGEAVPAEPEAADEPAEISGASWDDFAPEET